VSYTTITASTADTALKDRITAAIAKETYANPQLGASLTGQQVMLNGPETMVHRFMWPIAIDNEAAYESALVASNPDPGGDPSVITDANIASGIQTHWPDKLT
jgi:hypothetical protein